MCELRSHAGSKVLPQKMGVDIILGVIILSIFFACCLCICIFFFHKGGASPGTLELYRHLPTTVTGRFPQAHSVHGTSPDVSPDATHAPSAPKTYDRHLWIEGPPPYSSIVPSKSNESFAKPKSGTLDESPPSFSEATAASRPIDTPATRDQFYVTEL